MGERVLESSRLLLELDMVLRFWKVTFALSVERKDAEEVEAPSSSLVLIILLSSIMLFLWR